MASARIPKFAWRPGEEFSAEIWLFNDTPNSLPAGRVAAQIVCAGRAIDVLDWKHPGTAANRHLSGPTLRCSLPDGADRFVLRVALDGRPDAASEYVLPLLAETRAPAIPPGIAPLNL